MSLKIPEYINNIAPYVAGKPIAEVEREYGIANSIKLASNENPLGPSPKAVEAMEAAMTRIHRYPDEPGYALLNRIAEHAAVHPGQVIIGNGSDDVLGLLSRALLEPGDEVIVPTPSFLMYSIVAQTAGAKLVEAPLNGMEIDLDIILAKVTSATRLIFICNPNNPTGAIVTKDAFSRFLDALSDDLVVVVDEAYIQYVRDPQCAQGLQFLNNDTPVVVLRTFSKAYGLAGLRVGYGVMSQELAGQLNKVRMPFNVNTLAQAAAEAALDDTAFLRQSVELVHQSLDLLYEALDKRDIRYFPTQSNFFLIDVARDATQVFEQMLRQGVIIRSMRGYGFPEYIRVNIGLPEENQRFLDALDTVLD
ncbi:MAG: histidinol-phosphate transaminase [Desulfobacteraceae bacterium]|jgi:histidinol-phosphate aminotransferase